METVEKITTKKQNVNLVQGSYTASEASDIINSLLNVKINFHKLNRLSITEGNVKDKCEHDSGRIQELIKEKESAKKFLAQAKQQGKKLKMTAKVLIEIVD